MATTQAPAPQAVTAPADPIAPTTPTSSTPTSSTTEPAPTRGARPLPRPRIDFKDPEYRALVRRMCCTNSAKPDKSATDDEFALFIGYCERQQLDPLAKQVYFMKRGSDDAESGAKARGGPELSIDSLRLIAERTGEYCGQTAREWARVAFNRGEAHIEWYPVWPFKSETPYACRVGVYRAGFSEPLVAVARYDAYVQTTGYGANAKPNRMWAKMGPEQLGKCAEALALRQAFPNELGGSYTTDEMAQAENDTEDPRAQRHPRQTRTRPAAQQRPTQDGTAVAADPAPEREPHPMAVKPGDTVSGVPPVLFPYGLYENVPLNARWPDGHAEAGQYVVPMAKLQEAEGKASDRLKQIDATKLPRRAAAVRSLLDALADELEQRAAEDDVASEPMNGGSA